MATTRHHTQDIMETTLNSTMETTRHHTIISCISLWEVSIDHKVFKRMPR
jgi:PIN domain nuclease of toxin-antitoxin system